jgi:hypothetical protein
MMSFLRLMRLGSVRKHNIEFLYQPPSEEENIITCIIMEMKSSGKEWRGDEKIYAALSWRQTLQQSERVPEFCLQIELSFF